MVFFSGCYKEGGHPSDEAITFYNYLNKTKNCFALFLEVSDLRNPKLVNVLGLNNDNSVKTWMNVSRTEATKKNNEEQGKNEKRGTVENSEFA